MDFPRTQKWVTMTRLAATACARLPPAWIAEFYLRMTACPRYAADAGFPEELRGSPRTLEAYARGRRLVAQEIVADGRFEPAIEKLFANREVEYVQVNSTTAGCFTFRIERP
jgi:hypothetical protein